MWISLAFLSALLLGFYDVFKKKSLVNNAVIPVLFLNTLFASLLFLPAILLSHHSDLLNNTLLYIPPMEWYQHGYIMLKSCIVLTSWICGYFALKHLPLTLVGPINATRPVLVLLGAILILGESLSIWQWVGVTLSVISFFLLSRTGKKEGFDFRHNQWILLLILAAVSGAASGLYDKYLMTPLSDGGLGMDKMAVQSWYNLYQCCLMLGVMLVLWFPQRHHTTPFRWHWSIPLITLFLSIADFAYFYALSLPGAMIAVVSMVRRGSVLVSFMWGVLVLKEQNAKQKLFDLLLVLLSLICLYIGSS